MSELTDVAWDPGQYLRFADLRLRPALELLARVPFDAPGRVVDLGCGPGNVTQYLIARWPEAAVTGIDSSREMLEKAQAEGPAGVTWEQGDAATWSPDPAPDVIYSNAALHWLPSHETLFPRLFGLIAAGGVLAVQMPRNFAQPSHTLIDETAREEPWAARLAPVLRTPPVSGPGFYYDLLAADAAAIDVWETEYQQVLEGPEAVAEFTKGTWLKPILDTLDPAERPEFEARYIAKLADAYPRRADGRVLFAFRRLFIVAVR
jgi:trans-aconitate 2-methyltransferase